MITTMITAMVTNYLCMYVDALHLECFFQLIIGSSMYNRNEKGCLFYVFCVGNIPKPPLYLKSSLLVVTTAGISSTVWARLAALRG